MKEDHHGHHHQRKLRDILSNSRSKPTAYIILLILTYALGYFSAPSKSSLSDNTTHLTVSTAAETVASSTTPTNSNNCPTAADDHKQFGRRCSAKVRPNRVRQKIVERVFDGTSPYDNFPPAHLARLIRPKRVKGWGSYGAVFENLIKKVRPKVIIEVGTFLGASAIHMAELTRRFGLDTQILCLDDFRGWPGFRDKVNYTPMLNGDVLLLPQFLQNVIYFNATASILPVPFSTGSGLEKLCEWGVLAELIEVDAGHDFHSAWADINRAHKLLRPGGVMFGHDYFTSYDNRGVRRAVDLFARVNGFKIKVDGQHWVIDSS